MKKITIVQPGQKTEGYYPVKNIPRCHNKALSSSYDEYALKLLKKILRKRSFAYERSDGGA